MKTNQELKNAALVALKGKWTPSVMATLVLFACMMIKRYMHLNVHYNMIYTSQDMEAT